MATRIYKAEVGATFGDFIIAVDSTKEDAKSDIRTAAMTAFNMPIGMIKAKNIAKSNRHILANMSPIKNCQFDGKDWGWFRRV